MAGKKGRSGRRSKRDEEKRLEIIDKAWDIVGETLNSKSISNHDKLSTARDVVIKDMVTKGEGFGSPIHVTNITQNIPASELRRIVALLRAGVSQEKPQVDNRQRLPQNQD